MLPVRREKLFDGFVPITEMASSYVIQSLRIARGQ